jgi:hypothetical protein
MDELHKIIDEMGVDGAEVETQILQDAVREMGDDHLADFIESGYFKDKVKIVPSDHNDFWISLCSDHEGLEFGFSIHRF